MLKGILLVALGGAIGSVLRYLVGIFMGPTQANQYPWAIFITNIIGCFIIGLLSGFAVHKHIISREWQMFLITGLCGGFTSYSSFSYDIFSLFNHGNPFYALLFMMGSVTLGVFAVIMGFYILK